MTVIRNRSKVSVSVKYVTKYQNVYTTKSIHVRNRLQMNICPKMVQVGNDQDMAQSERKHHPKTEVGKNLN